MFDQLIDLTEPICQRIDPSKASLLLFDTSGIEAWVTENNPKYANRIIKQLKAFKKANGPDITFCRKPHLIRHSYHWKTSWKQREPTMPWMNLSALKWSGKEIVWPENPGASVIVKTLALHPAAEGWFTFARKRISVPIPERPRGTEEWDSTYKIRVNVEKSIHYFKDSFCIAGRKTQNEKTLHADLLPAGIT